MSRHGFRGDRAHGQFCLVLPEHDEVIDMTAATVQMQDVLDAVWEHLLPVFCPAQRAALLHRLSRFEPPPVPANSMPLADPDAWSGAGSRRRVARARTSRL
jgi:hypothetical protein